MPVLPLPLREGQPVGPLGITLPCVRRFAALNPPSVGVGRTATAAAGAGTVAVAGFLGRCPHWRPCPCAPFRLAVPFPGGWGGGVGGCGVWVHRARPAVSVLVVGGSRDRVAPRCTCGDFVAPPSPPVRSSLTRRSDAVFSVPAQPPSPSCATVSGGAHRCFPCRVAVTAGAPCRGAAVARQSTGLAWCSFPDGCRRRACCAPCSCGHV